jgi:hypothetical protein
MSGTSLEIGGRKVARHSSALLPSHLSRQYRATISEHRLYLSKGNRGNPMVANSAIWTIADLAAMPNDDGWKCYEVIDGELLVTRAPHIVFVVGVDRLFS